MHGPLRQPGGDRFVVGCGIVCRDKAAAVRAVDAAVRKVDAVLLRAPAGARLHHAEAEALHLLRQQAAAVKFPGGVAVAFAENGAGQRIDGVGDLAEQTGKVRFARHGCIAAQYGAVFFVLRQPHVRHAGADGRHAARGREQQQVAVEQRVLRADGDGRQRVVQRKDLIQLQLVAPALRGVRVIDAQLAQLPAEQLQRQQQRAADVAEPDERDAQRLCALPVPALQNGECGGKRRVQHAGAVSRHKFAQRLGRRRPLRRRQQHTGRLGLEDLVQHGNGKQAAGAQRIAPDKKHQRGKRRVCGHGIRRTGSAQRAQAEAVPLFKLHGSFLLAYGCGQAAADRPPDRRRREATGHSAGTGLGPADAGGRGPRRGGAASAPC